MKKPLIGAIALSISASLWGGMYVVSKATLEFIPPFTLVWLRYVVAFIMLVLLYHKQLFKKKHSFNIIYKQIFPIAMIGYFGSISLQFLGTKLSNAHTGALITTATPAFMVFFGWYILKEKLSIRKIASLTLASIGVLIIIAQNFQQAQMGLGSVLLVLAALTWAYQSIAVKQASKLFSITEITTYAIGLAMMITFIPMLIELSNTHTNFNNPFSLLLGVLYLGVFATAGAFSLWNKGLAILEASHASLFFFFQPIVGSLLGWYFLQENLTLRFFLGAGFIFLAVILVSIKSIGENHTKF